MDLQALVQKNFIRSAYWYNRAALSLKKKMLGPSISFGSGCDIWASRLAITGKGKASFGQAVTLERSYFPLILDLAPGSQVQIGDRAWIRGKYRANVFTCFENASIQIGPDCFINGAIISAWQRVSIGRRSMISWDVTILDSHMHQLDNDSPLHIEPVEIGDHVMIASGAVIMAGSRIGSHSVVGARSVVRGHFPDHSVIAGSPARVIKQAGDRDRVI